MVKASHCGMTEFKVERLNHRTVTLQILILCFVVTTVLIRFLPGATALKLVHVSLQFEVILGVLIPAPNNFLCSFDY